MNGKNTLKTFHKKSCSGDQHGLPGESALQRAVVQLGFGAAEQIGHLNSSELGYRHIAGQKLIGTWKNSELNAGLPSEIHDSRPEREVD